MRSGGKNITYKEEFIQKESESRRPREETFGEIVKFKVRDGVHFYSSKEKDLRVVAEKERVDILQSIHVQPHGGHLLINKTLISY